MPVEEPVEDDVSESLIVGDGVGEGVRATLPDSDIDAPNEKVVVGVDVDELLRLLEVVGVGKGVIVGLGVPEVVSAAEGV